MNLQEIVDCAEEIEHLRKARDLLRSVQWEMSKSSSDLIMSEALSDSLKEKINEYFD